MQSRWGYLRGLDLGSLDPNRQLGSLGFAGQREAVTRRRPGLQAMDDNEGHTINDELRMMGLEGGRRGRYGEGTGGAFWSAW